MSTTISCVIRTYNEAKYIGILIETLKRQKYSDGEVEIIVIDSGSTDSTVEIARSFDVNLIEIPKVEFNYSRTLNLGIEHSMGDFIVILSAHSMPCKNDWLYRMITHFEDKKVAGVYCRQVPWHDAGWYEVLRVSNMFGNTSRIYRKENRDVDFFFSNAASCIRRSVWQEHPFIMSAAEDQEWADWALRKGYEILYDAEAMVYHSHTDNCRQTAQRMIELEMAADIRLRRNRNTLLTCKQAFGLVYGSLRQIIPLNNCKWSKAKMILDCFAQGFWYVMDFKRKSNSG
jgi:rhamnosyltransferase